MTEPTGGSFVLDEVARRTLQQRLDLLKQGDVITLGATNVVGRGPTPTVAEASPGVTVGPDQVWTLTLVSELGLYVVLSQDCDIVRASEVEPCLLVCPLEAVPEAEWTALRRGPYSPREFPYPPAESLGLAPGVAPVANLRFVTSLDKAAVLSDAFGHAPALRSAALRERFTSWLGRRVARAAHSDALERDVLAAAGERVRSLAKQAAKKAGSGLSPVQMLVLAAEEWFLAPGEQLVPLQLIVTPSSAAAAGLWDDSTGAFKEAQIGKAAVALAADLSKRATAGLGYVVTVEVHTLDRVPTSQYRTWAEWRWDHDNAWTAEG